MSSRDNLLIQTIKLLSQRVAMLEPFFNITACLNPEERQLIGYCEAYRIMFGDQDKEFSQFLQEKAIPMLEKIGISRWPRTELTDLGLKISNKDEEEVSLGVSTEETESIRQ